jgi:hypothetical protein
VEAEPLDLPLVPDDATLWEFQSRPPLVANPWFAWGEELSIFHAQAPSGSLSNDSSPNGGEAMVRSLAFWDFDTEQLSLP